MELILFLKPSGYCVVLCFVLTLNVVIKLKSTQQTYTKNASVQSYETCTMKKFHKVKFVSYILLECSLGMYGSGCGNTCGNCLPGSCDHVTGYCLQGCQAGFDYSKDSRCKTG